MREPLVILQIKYVNVLCSLKGPGKRGHLRTGLPACYRPAASKKHDTTSKKSYLKFAY